MDGCLSLPNARAKERYHRSQPGDPGLQAAIARALSSPYASDGERKIASILIQQQIAQQDPMRALQMQKLRRDLNAAPERKTTTINGRLVDAQTGEEIASYPDQMKPTSDMQEYEFAKSQGFPGSFVDFQLAQKRAGASSVNVDTKGETKFDQTMGEELAKKTIGILDAGQQAPTKIATYNQLLQSLPSMYTGTGGDTILSAKRALKGLGFDIGDLSGPEFVQAMGNQMALELRNPAGGAGMPGAMSDKDREFLASMSPGLTKTPEGNRKLLEYRIAMEQRNQQVAQLANQYMSAHGGRIDNNFYSELSKWSNANPLFPEASNADRTARPTTQQQFDALPSGATYVDPDDGKTYRKP